MEEQTPLCLLRWRNFNPLIVHKENKKPEVQGRVKRKKEEKKKRKKEKRREEERKQSQHHRRR
jgi:hypothetical protein